MQKQKMRKKKIYILKTSLFNNGYLYFSLCHESKVYSRSVARMIAIAFIPNPENKRCINHKNLIKTDNRVENLEWVTYKENNDHSVKNGNGHYFKQGNIFQFKKGHKPRNTKLNIVKVNQIRELWVNGKYRQWEIAKMFNISREHVSTLVLYREWV